MGGAFKKIFKAVYMKKQAKKAPAFLLIFNSYKAFLFIADIFLFAIFLMKG